MVATMKTYTLTELEEAWEECQNDQWVEGALTAEDFFGWLRKQEEIEEILSAEDEVESAPVDLFGVGGVAGLATREELDQLAVEADPIMMTTDTPYEDCCDGKSRHCCHG